MVEALARVVLVFNPSALAGGRIRFTHAIIIKLGWMVNEQWLSTYTSTNCI
jgi:hypothetical protein